MTVLFGIQVNSYLYKGLSKRQMLFWGVKEYVVFVLFANALVFIMKHDVAC